MLVTFYTQWASRTLFNTEGVTNERCMSSHALTVGDSEEVG